jgi:hypothetical protein
MKLVNNSLRGKPSLHRQVMYSNLTYNSDYLTALVYDNWCKDALVRVIVLCFITFWSRNESIFSAQEQVDIFAILGN